MSQRTVTRALSCLGQMLVFRLLTVSTFLRVYTLFCSLFGYLLGFLGAALLAVLRRFLVSARKKSDDEPRHAPSFNEPRQALPVDEPLQAPSVDGSQQALSVNGSQQALSVDEPQQVFSVPHAVYSPTANYPQYQSLASAAYPSSSTRGAMPATAAVNTHYSHQPMPISHASVERTMANSRTTTQLPYARNAPTMSPVDYEPHPDPSEPTIKKKRKRADARQLEVLNATYARTAFPSTEERAALAKQLDMSARSVQIWSVQLFCRHSSCY